MFEQILQMTGPFFYLGLALIAFADTLIGVGFFVLGEVAFLAAGLSFGATGDWFGVLVVLIFAWLGDLTSYLLGRRYGLKTCRAYLKPVKRRRSLRKAQGLIKRHGALFVIAARLMGPVAWITPFLAGSLKMPLIHFQLASFFGVMLGVGQFIIVGALGPSLLAQLQELSVFFLAHGTAVVVTLASLGSGLAVWFLVEHSFLRRLTLSCLAGATLFATVNLAYFFVLSVHAVPTEKPVLAMNNACELHDRDLVIAAGPTELHLPQPINIALISSRRPEDVMAELGWLQNKTYGRDDINLLTFFQLLLAGTPPVSDFTFNKQPAQSAFQLPGSISERVHIRWWSAGILGDKNIYLGAISRDEELAIKYYGSIPAILHDIDPNVDKVRDALARQAQASPSLTLAGLSPLQKPVTSGQNSDYYTDGGIAILTDSDQSLSANLRNCLKL